MKKIILLTLPVLLLASGCANNSEASATSSTTPVSSLETQSSSLISSSIASSFSAAPVSSSSIASSSSVDDGRTTESVTITFNSDEAAAYGTYNENGNKSSYVWKKANFEIENSSIGEHRPDDYISKGHYRVYVKSKLWFKSVNRAEIKYVTLTCVNNFAFNGNEEFHNCTYELVDATTIKLIPNAGLSKFDFYNLDTVNNKNTVQKRLLSATMVYYA